MLLEHYINKNCILISAEIVLSTSSKRGSLVAKTGENFLIKMAKGFEKDTVNN